MRRLRLSLVSSRAFANQFGAVGDNFERSSFVPVSVTVKEIGGALLFAADAPIVFEAGQ